jgi:hypothetical protein
MSWSLALLAGLPGLVVFTAESVIVEFVDTSGCTWALNLPEYTSLGEAEHDVGVVAPVRPQYNAFMYRLPATSWLNETFCESGTSQIIEPPART